MVEVNALFYSIFEFQRDFCLPRAANGKDEFIAISAGVFAQN